MYYFAYGSNMSVRRLQSRCTKAKSIGVYRLDGYRLLFNKQSLDGSGKGNIEVQSGCNSVVYGVVFDMPELQIADLDRCEGLGVGYDKCELTVQNHHGNSDEELRVFAYVALQLNANLKPYDWYLNHLIVGAAQAKMPQHYIDFLHSFDTLSDPNLQRQQTETAIYLP